MDPPALDAKAPEDLNDEERAALAAADAAGETDPDPEPDPAGELDTELVIDGTGQLSLTGIGGKSPTSASLVLSGGKVVVDSGQFEKGATVVVEVEAVVRQVAFVDSVDSKTGQVVSSDRKHTARIVGLRVVG